MCLLCCFTLQSYGFLAELSSKMQYIQDSRLAVRQKLISFVTNIAALIFCSWETCLQDNVHN